MTYPLIVIWKLLVTIPLWFYKKKSLYTISWLSFLVDPQNEMFIKMQILLTNWDDHCPWINVSYDLWFSLNPRRLMLTIFLWNQGTCISSCHQTYWCSLVYDKRIVIWPTSVLLGIFYLFVLDLLTFSVCLSVCHDVPRDLLLSTL